MSTQIIPNKENKNDINKMSEQRLRTLNLFTVETEHIRVRYMIAGYKYFQVNNEKGNYLPCLLRDKSCTLQWGKGLMLKIYY